MEDALMEAKAALAKSKDKMAKYYDCRQTPAPVYQPGDKVYLDTSNIQMTRPSQKLTHKRLGPFTIVRKVGNGAYRLHCHLLQWLKNMSQCLHDLERSDWCDLLT